jgi:6,7-dimethyl-8-ribityllumazine synthase
MAELTQTINQANEPFGFSRIASEKSPVVRGELARKVMPEVMRESQAAERGVMEAEREARLKQAQEGTKVEQTFQRGIQSAQQTLQQQSSERPERNFSEFDPKAGIELAALTAILGSFAGAVSGRAALQSMKGVTEGYRLGQQDLYDRSAKQFEYELSKHKEKLQNAQQNYQLAQEAEQVKRGAGVAKLREFAPELSGSLGEAHLRNNDIKSYKNYLDEWAKLTDQMALKAEEARLKPSPKPRFAQLKVEGSDREGNKRTLIFNPYDENYVPVENPTPDSPGFVGFAAEKSQQIGGRESQFAGRVQQALSSAGTEIMNVIKAPGLAEMPVFAGTIGRNPEGVFASLIALGARKATREEERAFQALTSGISAALGRIESQGLANGTTLANLKAFDEMKPLAGDSPLVTALYLSRLKQELDVGLGVYTTNRATTKEQREEVKKRVQPVLDAINFEPADVLRAMQKSPAGRNNNLLQRSQSLINKPVGTITDTPQDLTSRLTIGNDPAAIQIRSDLANGTIDMQTARAQLEALGYD